MRLKLVQSYLLSLLLVPVATADTLPIPSAISYYTFDGDAADSIGSNHLAGTAGFSPGKIGSHAASFSTSFLQNSTFIGHGDIKTADFWIKPATAGAHFGLFGFGNCAGATPSPFAAQIQADGRLLMDNFLDNVSEWRLISSSTILPGQWTHIVLSIGPAQTSLYVNGAEEATSTDMSGFHEDSLCVGASSGGSFPFDGEIDNLLLADFPYTQHHVNTSFNGGNGVSFLVIGSDGPSRCPRVFSDDFEAGDGRSWACGEVDRCGGGFEGVEWRCRERFMYGINYAWHHFGADFGGLAAWDQEGVAGGENPSVYSREIREIRDKGGARVLRWWVFPDFRGDGVDFGITTGDSAFPYGLGGAVSRDMLKALEIAESEDVYYILTLFSFDAFAASHTKSRSGYVRMADGAARIERFAQDDGGVLQPLLSGSSPKVAVPSIQPMIRAPHKRTALLENVVRPLARIVQNSPYSNRVLAWDVINEPEWAITGIDEKYEGLYSNDSYMDGEPYPFQPKADVDGVPLRPVKHEEMGTFVDEVVTVLRCESEALITVGQAKMRWRHTFANTDLDFWQIHFYDFDDTDVMWPHWNSPATYGLDSKPVVVGEFPMDFLYGIPFSGVLDDFWFGGYAGALSWSYSKPEPEDAALNILKPFAEERPCATRY